jgi:3-deoxy-7-phosphoheptulonate synthase
MSENTWHPDSWRDRTVAQEVDYPDRAALNAAVERLRTLPPLVTSWEIERLRQRLVDAAEGRAFLLQGGDCAETFTTCDPAYITAKMKIILQMSLVLSQGLKLPVIRVGRIAGQYAKPRSAPLESRDGVSLPSYYGDLVNEEAFTAEMRRPDPQRMLDGHAHAAMTLNFIRGLIEGGFADLHHPDYWDLAFLDRGGLSPRHREAYHHIKTTIANALEFFEAISSRAIPDLARIEFYTSHEALHLPYEAALTRAVPRKEGYFNLGCHLPWIGNRTRRPDGAHIEYARGISNPVGVKIGTGFDAAEVRELVETLDPNCETGRVVLIARFGAERVTDDLPRAIEVVRATGRRVVWSCDPMHGNTSTIGSGRKTRRFDAVMAEVERSIDIHRAQGSNLGGVHVELTGENVCECVGGASGVTEQDLDTGYVSACDPRLNYDQSMELAFAIATRMGKGLPL